MQGLSKKHAGKSSSHRFKRGVASFYIVAISTLILVIIGASFAAVIISAVTRSSNDDLSQSAYDAALAGLEDAKLTLYNYQQCKLPSGARGNIIGMVEGDCEKLIAWVERGENNYGDIADCDIVAHSLGRVPTRDGNNNSIGTLVQETNSGTDQNGMLQYYTCVIISSTTNELLGQLTTERPDHAFKLKFAGETEAQSLEKMRLVNRVKISWHATKQNGDRVGFKWPEIGPNGAFSTEKSTPAKIAFSIAQSSDSFSFSDFDKTVGNQTNRGTIYLVPRNSTNLTGSGDLYREISSSDERNPILAKEGLAKSNDKGSDSTGSGDTRNLAFVVGCNDREQEYVCEATTELPEPINGNRHDLVVSVSLLHAEPNTDFRLQFYHDDTLLPIDAVQISIDSTGRANDLFRRVDTRMEAADVSYPFPLYAIEALDDGNQNAIWKNFYSTCEYNFDDRTCS